MDARTTPGGPAKIKRSALKTAPGPFFPRERRLIARLRTPLDVQRYLNRLPYNTEPPPGGATLRSFRGVVRAGCAHCLEAALFAATVLEQHGYPPLVLSFPMGIGGAVARSGTSRPATAVQNPAYPRAQLRRSLCGLHRARDGVCGCRLERPRDVRLAARHDQRLESRAHAARLPTPAD